MPRLNPRSISLALVTLLMVPGIALAVPGPGEVGGVAPDWTLQAYQGDTHTLSDYSGKVVFMFVVGYG